MADVLNFNPNRSRGFDPDRRLAFDAERPHDFDPGRELAFQPNRDLGFGHRGIVFRGEMCPRCGTVVATGSQRCPECGASLEAAGPEAAAPEAPSPREPSRRPWLGTPSEDVAQVAARWGFCAWCGGRLAPGDKFCPRCGSRIRDQEERRMSGEP